MTTEERRRFDIGPCIGSGGFGEVYLATMVSGGGVRSEVALKVLHRGLDPRSQAVQRLADEAKLLGLLNHPNILRIHDLVLLDGRITLVTEYVAGLDLDQCVVGPEEPLGPRALLQVTGHVAAALHTAYHTPGPDGAPLHLLHRDIKPSNIRVGRHGEVKLLDFGIAKAAGEREAKTQTNALIGSFSYMSPERLDREGNDDAPGDVFALGCTLYEMLKGDMLFDGTIRELYRLAMDQPKHVAYVQAHVNALEVDPALHALLHDLLAYEPDARPPLDQLAERCEDLADDLPGRTLGRWCRARDWGEVRTENGELSGKTITETSLSADMLDRQLTGEAPRPTATPVDPTQATGRYDTDRAAEGTSDTFAWTPDGQEEPGEAPDEAALPPAPPPDPPKGLPLWIKLAGVLAIGLLVGLGGATAVLGVGGVAWLAALTPVAVEGDGPTPQPADVHVPGPNDRGKGQAPEATDTPPPPVPDDGGGARGQQAPPPAPGEAPAPDDDDGAAEAQEAIDVSAGENVCGEPASLESPAATGALPDRARRCLASAITDHDLAQVVRDKLGRLLLADAKARCDTHNECGDYELHQRVFFEEVTRSDAEMLYVFAAHLTQRATTDDARAEALTWTHRALERRSSWTGRTHVKRVSALYEQKARLSYDRWEADNRNERLRVEARNASVEWMNHLIQLGRDHDPALKLCASVEGSEDVCKGRGHDVGASFVVTLASTPPGATLYIDGQQVGITPHQADLPSGSYEARMVHGGIEGRRTIQVDADQPTKWTWTAQTDHWAEVF